MEPQKKAEQASLPFCAKLTTALCQKVTKRKDPAPQAPTQGQEVAQQNQQRYEAVATQFHCFPDLPAELRLQIWAEATRYKRYVVLDPPCNSAAACLRLCLRILRYGSPEYSGERRPAWTSRTPPPTLLSVSREAREVALGTWQRAFGYGVFPAVVYISFDQDDVVVGASARVNKIGRHFIPRWLQPCSSLVARLMVGIWIQTPDVEKIQRVMACGTFMRGMYRMTAGREFMNGLKSLTVVRIGDLKEPDDMGYRRRIYATTKRSSKGASLLSLGGIDFVKTTSASLWATKSFAEVEVLDFVGGSSWAEIQACWTMGPEALGWEPVEDNLPTRVHLGPGKQCVRRAKWRCCTTLETEIWYAI